MRSRLDRKSPVPLYHQLRTALLDRIKRGDWKPGEQLPTEDELATQHRVSKATVRQALRDLAEAGLVRREQGRGTFVQDARVRFGPTHLTSFTEEMRDCGMRSSSKVLDRGIVQAEPGVALKLRVEAGDSLYRLERLRLAGEETMGLQTVHLPCGLVPGLMETDFEVESLYETLARRYGLVPDHASQRHFAMVLDRRQAELLRVPEGAPALGGERLTFLQDGRPMELTSSVMRGDRYQVQLKLVRTQLR